MARKRRRFTIEFKVRVVRAALREDKTLAELASQLGVHPNQITNWKRQLLNALSDVASGRMSEAPNRLAKASNTIVLVASQLAVAALLTLLDFNDPSNRTHFTREKHNKLPKELVLAIRADMKTKPTDDPETVQLSPAWIPF